MKRAVVIGAGIGGLAAAKVLSKYFDKVLVYDGGTPPQSHHLHVLLKSGQDSLEKLFPGISQKFQERSCPVIDWAQDTIWENRGRFFPRYKSSVQSFSMGRGLLNTLMKEMITEKNVEFISLKVSDFNPSDSDLVVLAGGQNFPLHKFVGKESFHEESYPVRLTYRSFLFNKADLRLPEDSQYYSQIDPSLNNIGGVITPIEDGLVMATLIEYEKNFSSCHDYSDFLNKAQQMKSDFFVNILKDALPLTEINQYRKEVMFRRKLKLNSIPDKVIVVGDSLLSLNPVFGQGMSVTLKQIKILDEMFSKGIFSQKSFQKRCEKSDHFPYRISFLGSRENGIGKRILRLYIRVSQQSNVLHHFFLRQLHSIKLFPGSFP